MCYVTHVLCRESRISRRGKYVYTQLTFVGLSVVDFELKVSARFRLQEIQTISDFLFEFGEGDEGTIESYSEVGTLRAQLKVYLAKHCHRRQRETVEILFS